MRLEGLKNDLPETPDFIHNIIQEEVTRQTKTPNIIPMKAPNKLKWKIGRVAAVALIGIMGTSVAAYAGTKLYYMYLEHRGQYSVATGINVDEGTKKIQLPEEIHDIEISAGYIPDGMEWMDDYKLNYSDTPYQGGISISWVLMDQDDLGKAWIDKGVIESEELTFSEHEGVYVKLLDLKQDKSFDKRIYLFYPEEYRVFTIYFGDDVTREDAIKFVENMTITEKDDLIETKGAETWSDLVNPEADTDDLRNKVSEDQIIVNNIGDNISLESMYEDAAGNTDISDGISVCVDNVQILDNLCVLDGADLPEEWEAAVASDGTLKQNHLSYVKSGDGENTLDKVVNEAAVNQKLVYAQVTYTNNTDAELRNILYHGSLITMKHENSSYRLYLPSEEPGDDYDYYMEDGVAKTGSMTYYSAVEDYGNGGNYIGALAPGESVQVVMAWIVDETDLDNMYLNLNSDGSIIEFTDSMLKGGVISLSAHK